MSSFSSPPTPSVAKGRDGALEGITFATASGVELLLDLLLPSSTDAPIPVAVYLHGGGWTAGHRRMDTARRAEVVAGLGVGIATIDYRLGEPGRFPAAVHDVRGAVRWLRAHGAELGLATGRIGAWGSSAGGHLALVAALGRDGDYEGDVGGNTHHSSSIDAVVNFFATSDLVAKTARSPMERRVVAPGHEDAFLGLSESDVGGRAARIRSASPLALVHSGAPPILSVHGDYDQVVPIVESERLHDALVAVGAPSTLVRLGGAGHEDPAFEQAFVLQMVASFLLASLSDPEGRAARWPGEAVDNATMC
jgi:acetyl esterase/lipase